jgi:hypothetical protein
MQVSITRGGAYLGEGADTCVVTPNIACSARVGLRRVPDRAEIPPDPANVSRIVNSSSVDLGQELDIHRELMSNPVYAPFLRGGSEHALESVTIADCSLSKATVNDVKGFTDPDGPCSYVNDAIKDTDPTAIDDYTNLITPLSKHKGLWDVLARRYELLFMSTKSKSRIVQNENGVCIGSIFKNVLRFLETTHSQDVSIIHGDFHFGNAFISNDNPQPGGPMPVVFMHDFGRGMLFDRLVYDPRMLNDNELARVETHDAQGRARTAEEILKNKIDNLNVVVDMPSKYPQISFPFIILWRVYVAFAEEELRQLTQGGPQLHNEVVRNVLDQFLELGSNHQMHLNQNIPKINFLSNYVLTTIAHLKANDETASFVNLFNGGYDTAMFPNFMNFLENCLTYVDIISICNNILTNSPKLILKTSHLHSIIVLKQRIQRVFDAILNMECSATPVSIRTLIDILSPTNPSAIIPIGGRPPSKKGGNLVRFASVELAIQTEIRTNPVYAQYRRGGAKYALDIESSTTNTPLDGVLSTNLDLLAMTTQRPFDILNIDLIEPGIFIGQLFNNILDFLETTHSQDKSIIHGDLHFGKALIDNSRPQPGDPIPNIYMHDFGRGMLFDKTAYDPEMMHKHYLARVDTKGRTPAQVLDDRDFRVFTFIPFISNPIDDIQYSPPMVILWYVYRKFVEEELDIVDGSVARPHNVVVREIANKLYNLGPDYQIYSDKTMPRVNFQSRYITSLMECLLAFKPAPDDNIDDRMLFVNVFNGGYDTNVFRRFMMFMEGCLKYVDITAICNVTQSYLTRLFNSIGGAAVPASVQSLIYLQLHRIQRVYNTIYNIECGVNPTDVSIRALRDILFIPTSGASLTIGGNRQTRRAK